EDHGALPSRMRRPEIVAVPAFAQRLIDAIGFEADRLAGGGERTFGAGAEDDVAVDEAKVDRKRDRLLLGEEDEATDAASGKVGFALFFAENVEMRVRAGASRTRRPVDLAASQVVDRRFERPGEADQRATRKRDCRA